jgi:hypothetical protein
MLNHRVVLEGSSVELTFDVKVPVMTVVAIINPILSSCSDWLRLRNSLIDGDSVKLATVLGDYWGVGSELALGMARIVMAAHQQSTFFRLCLLSSDGERAHWEVLKSL